MKSSFHNALCANAISPDGRGLFPDDPARGTVEVGGAMRPKARTFGKLPDSRSLRPGDLLLSRCLNPDRVSRYIEYMQLEGGYGPRDAQWTHASMVVDDSTVIEADLDLGKGRSEVLLRHIEEYSNGEHVLLLRRPILLATESDRAKILKFAFLQRGRRYGICALLWNVLRFMRGHRFYHVAKSTRRLSINCSELYSYAYSKATGRTLLERNESCPPALLSASSDFEDVPMHWLKIVSANNRAHHSDSSFVTTHHGRRLVAAGYGYYDLLGRSMSRQTEDDRDLRLRD